MGDLITGWGVLASRGELRQLSLGVYSVERTDSMVADLVRGFGVLVKYGNDGQFFEIAARQFEH